MIGVVVDFQLTPQHIGHPGGTGLTVVTEPEMLAIAGGVFNHPRLAIDGFPTVFTAQAQRVAVPGHDAIGVAEAAH